MALNFPQNPTNGQTYMGYVYSTAVGAWQAKPSAQSPFYTSDIPPANPVTGDSWFNTNDGTMYIYTYDGNTYQWVEHRSQIAKSQVGLVPVVPTSIAVGSGTAAVDVSGNVTFTGVSSISLNGCFSSAYKSYKIVLTARGTTNDSLAFRLRNGTTDNANTNYSFAGWAVSRAGTTGAPAGTDISWASLGSVSAATYHGAREFNVFNPYDTSWWTNYTTVNSDAYQLGLSVIAGMFTQTTQFDGITILMFSGNMTGTMKVYGYN